MDEDAKEARKIYNTYGKFFVEREEKNPDRKRISEIIISMINDLKEKKILDAGCGTGKECELLAKRGAKVVGIDVSEFMIKLARKKCKNLGVKFFLRDMERTGFERESFDLILSVFSLMYKKNLRAVLKEFRRILKKDGEFLVVVPHPIERMVKHTRNYFKRGKFLKINGNIRYFNYHWTLEDYLNSIISQGFRVEEIKELGSSSLRESYYPHYLIIRAKAI